MVGFILRQKTVWIDGKAFLIRELSGEQALALWPAFSEAESSGNVTEAYGEIVRRCFLTAKEQPVCASQEEVLKLPARILMSVATEILALSEIGLENSSGNVSSDPAAV